MNSFFDSIVIVFLKFIKNKQNNNNSYIAMKLFNIYCTKISILTKNILSIKKLLLFDVYLPVIKTLNQ